MRVRALSLAFCALVPAFHASAQEKQAPHKGEEASKLDGCPPGASPKRKLEGGFVAEFCLDAQERLQGTKLIHWRGAIYLRESYRDGLREGRSQSWYSPEGTQPKNEGDYRAGQKQGRWREWSEAGILRSEISYDQDKREGVQRLYDEAGKLSSEMNFHADTLEGDYARWREGILQERGVYSQGQKSGLWERFFPDGSPESQGIYLSDDTKSGEWRYMHASGTLRAVEYYSNGEPYGTWRSWFADGKYAEERNFVDGLEEGLSMTWYEDNGSPQQAHSYRAGRLDGPSTRWYRNQQRSEEGFHTEGKRDGVWRTWDEAGHLLSESTFSQGEPTGTWRRWYANGQAKEETSYQKGKEQGPFRQWSEQGVVLLSGEYQNGQRNGLWTRHRESGQPLLGALYRDGTILGYQGDASLSFAPVQFDLGLGFLVREGAQTEVSSRVGYTLPVPSLRALPSWGFFVNLGASIDATLQEEGAGRLLFGPSLRVGMARSSQPWGETLHGASDVSLYTQVMPALAQEEGESAAALRLGAGLSAPGWTRRAISRSASESDPSWVVVLAFALLNHAQVNVEPGIGDSPSAWGLSFGSGL